MEQKYAEYAAQKAVELLAIDSPTGFTDRAAAWSVKPVGLSIASSSAAFCTAYSAYFCSIVLSPF